MEFAVWSRVLAADDDQSTDVERTRLSGIAVTGAGGYLGRSLVDALSASGQEVVQVARADKGLRTDIPTIVGQLDETTWTEVLARCGTVVHLSGNTSVYSAEEDSRLSEASTVAPLRSLLRTLVEAQLEQAPRVCFASTVTVYGASPDLPVTEETPVQPITVYDLHKLAAEDVLFQGLQAGLVDPIILRLANVFGPSPSSPRASERGMLDAAMRMALSRESLVFYGDGLMLRDYVFIDDVISALRSAAEVKHPSERLLNLISGDSRTLRSALQEVAAVAAAEFAIEDDVVSVPWPTSLHPIERRSFRGARQRVQTVLGWSPEQTFTDAIRKSMKSYAQRDAQHGSLRAN